MDNVFKRLQKYTEDILSSMENRRFLEPGLAGDTLMLEIKIELTELALRQYLHIAPGWSIHRNGTPFLSWTDADSLYDKAAPEHISTKEKYSALRRGFSERSGIVVKCLVNDSGLLLIQLQNGWTVTSVPLLPSVKESAVSQNECEWWRFHSNDDEGPYEVVIRNIYDPLRVEESASLQGGWKTEIAIERRVDDQYIVQVIDSL